MKLIKFVNDQKVDGSTLSIDEAIRNLSLYPLEFIKEDITITAHTVFPDAAFLTKEEIKEVHSSDVIHFEFEFTSDQEFKQFRQELNEFLDTDF